MKIVVMYEDSNEQAAAENLARVLPRIGPMLANATLDGSGVSVRSGASNSRVSIRTRCCSASEEPAMNALLAAPNATVVIKQDEALAAVYGTPPATYMREPDWDQLFEEQPGALWDEAMASRNVVRSYGGNVVRSTGGRSDWSSCQFCGKPRLDGTQCQYCGPIVAGRNPRPRPKPEPPKPPRETRDLIFPEDDA
jgi:hypothetical protein